MTKEFYPRENSLATKSITQHQNRASNYITHKSHISMKSAPKIFTHHSNQGYHPYDTHKSHITTKNLVCENYRPTKNFLPPKTRLSAMWYTNHTRDGNFSGTKIFPRRKIILHSQIKSHTYVLHINHTPQRKNSPLQNYLSTYQIKVTTHRAPTKRKSWRKPYPQKLISRWKNSTPPKSSLPPMRYTNYTP